MASPLSRRELSDFSVYFDDELMKNIPLGRQASLDVSFQAVTNNVTTWTETNALNASPRSNDNNDFLSWTNQVNLDSNDDFSEITDLVNDEKKQTSTSMNHLRRNTDPVETNNPPASRVAPVVQGSKKRSHDISFLPTGPNTGEEFDQQVDDYHFNVDCLNLSLGKDPCKFCKAVGGKKKTNYMTTKE